MSYNPSSDVLRGIQSTSGSSLFTISSGSYSEQSVEGSKTPLVVRHSPNGSEFVVGEEGAAYIYDSSVSLQSTLDDIPSGDFARSGSYSGSGELAIGTDSGDLYIYEGESVKNTLSAGSDYLRSLDHFSGKGIVAGSKDNNLYMYSTLEGESLRLAGLSGGFGGMGSIFPIAGLPGSARAQMFGVVVIIGLIVWGWRD